MKELLMLSLIITVQYKLHTHTLKYNQRMHCKFLNALTCFLNSNHHHEGTECYMPLNL